MIVVLITSPKIEAEKIAKTLLDKRLCGCINIIGAVDSLFLWQGKIDAAKECLLVVKTADGLFRRLEKEVMRVHPYEVPEIVSFKLNNISRPYQKWLDRELGSSS